MHNEELKAYSKFFSAPAKRPTIVCKELQAKVCILQQLLFLLPET